MLATSIVYMRYMYFPIFCRTQRHRIMVIRSVVLRVQCVDSSIEPDHQIMGEAMRDHLFVSLF